MFKLIFFGTSEFAVASLEALIRDPRFEILGMVTQPDRPVGRHAKMTGPAVKRTVYSMQYEVCSMQQPEKLKDEPFASWIREVGPICDAFVVVSYGKILPQWLLDLPRKGVVNVHGSLLPRWRGPSPIQAAIASGDEMTGVTIMKLDAEMDHGPILARAEEKIRSDDTVGSLHDRLAILGAQTLPNTLANYLAGSIKPIEQDHTQATYCKLLTRDDGRLDFSKDAAELERLVRAYNPWPGTWTEFDGKRIKIHQGIVSQLPSPKLSPGTRILSNGFPAFLCGDGRTIEITSIQPEGKNIMTGKEFLQGHTFL